MWDSYIVNKKLDITSVHTMFKTKKNSNYKFNGESHNFWECVYLIDGKITAMDDEKIYCLNKSDIVFHKPMGFHKYSVEGNKSATLFIFSFSATGEILSFFENKVFHLTGENLNIMESLLKYIHSEDVNSTEAENLKMYLKVWDKISTYPQMVSLYITQLMLSLYDENDSIVPISTAYDASIYEKAVILMNNNISSSLSINEIASYCNVSETFLKNIFAKYSGLGVHKYFLKLKIRLATELIEKGISITEIAERLGFSSQGYFTTVYKRETGYLPSQIKRFLN